MLLQTTFATARNRDLDKALRSILPGCGLYQTVSFRRPVQVDSCPPADLVRS